MSTDPPEPPATHSPAEPSHDAVFQMNLEVFGERAGRLCDLARAGRLSPDSCFVALTQLWIQLAHAHRALADTLPARGTPASTDVGGSATDPSAARGTLDTRHSPPETNRDTPCPRPQARK